MKGLYLLTMKPVTYAANVAESDLADQGAGNAYVAALKARAQEEGRNVVIVSAQVRASLRHVSLSVTCMTCMSGLGLRAKRAGHSYVAALQMSHWRRGATSTSCRHRWM